MTINAFHPDYVKTHMPEFLAPTRASAQDKSGDDVKEKTRKMLELTNYYMFSKAGMPKGVK